MLKLAIPLVHTANLSVAEDFYCKRLGFQVGFAHRADEARPDSCYMGVSRDGIWIHVSSFSGDGLSGGVVNFLAEDMDTLNAEFVAKGVQIAEGPVDQTWGTREMYVRHPDNNCIRFICG